MNNQIAIIPTREEFDIIQTIAKTAAESKYFDKLGGLPGIFTIALYAREIDVPPMMALMGGFTNVQGKITMSAELMNMLIRRKGHKLSVVQNTNEICTIKGERSDTKETMTASFTIQEAKNAGLVKSGGAWEKYPSDMLFARCISRLRRRLFPDVATRAYVEGEIEEESKDKPENFQSQTLNSQNKQSTTSIDVTPITYITDLEATLLNELIGDDDEYRKNLLNFFKIESFSMLPAPRYQKLLEAIKMHNEKRLSQELATTPTE